MSQQKNKHPTPNESADVTLAVDVEAASVDSHHGTTKKPQPQAQVDEVCAAVPIQSHPLYPPMTVATACGPSTFTISYPFGGRKAVIVGREQYFGLPAGQSGRDRCIHFPKATIPAGVRCLVEFTLDGAPKTEDESGCALRIGFVPASSTGPRHLVHDLRDTPSSYLLDYFESKVLNEHSIITELPTIASYRSSRRLALLMDRKDASNQLLRVFVSEDGTDAGVKAHGDGHTVIQPPVVDYMPAANPFGRCKLTIHNTYFGNDIPTCYGR